jgi:hypothetical protein
MAIPDTNVLFLNPSGNVLGVPIGGGRSASAIRIDDDPNGLLRYFSTSDVHVFRARTATTVPGWAHVALRDAQGPLMLEGSSGGANGRRAAILLFGLSDSDLALSLDFPVLVSNLLDWLAPAGFIDASLIHPGAFVNVSLPDDQTRAWVTDPSGAVRDLVPVASDQGGVQAVYSATDLPGGYTLRLSSGPAVRVAHFVVDPVLQPVAETAVASPVNAQAAGRGSAGTAKVPVSLTAAVALVVLGVLAAEWLLAMRLQ